MNSTIRTIILAVTMLAPAFASAAWSFSFSWGSGGSICGTYLECFGSQIINVINSVLVPVLFAVAFIVFLYGIAKAYIFSIGNEEEVKKGHKLVMWGVIGFAVMVSIWGIVNIVASTFGLQGASAPLTPVSYPLY